MRSALVKLVHRLFHPCLESQWCSVHSVWPKWPLRLLGYSLSQGSPSAGEAHQITKWTPSSVGLVLHQRSPCLRHHWWRLNCLRLLDSLWRPIQWGRSQAPSHHLCQSSPLSAGMRCNLAHLRRSRPTPTYRSSRLVVQLQLLHLPLSLRMLAPLHSLRSFLQLSEVALLSRRCPDSAIQPPWF